MPLRINANTGKITSYDSAEESLQRIAVAQERIADSFEEYVKICENNKVS